MKPRHLSNSEYKTLTLTLSDMGQAGEGFCLSEGRRIYVPGGLPGETVKATLTDQLDRSVFRAALDEIVEASPQRATPPCPHYDHCGGCVLQHMEEEAYRAWKHRSVLERLGRAGLEVETIDPPVFIPQATRRRATFAVLKRKGAIHAGFHGRRSHEIAAIDSCLVVHPALLRSLEGSKPFLQRLLPERAEADLFLQSIDGQTEAVLTDPKGACVQNIETMETVSAWAQALDLYRIAWRRNARDDAEILMQPRPIQARFGRMTVALPPQAFLQPSAEGEAAMVETMLSMLENVKGKRFADLFAGCGTLTGALLGKGSVHAVEFDQGAVEALTAAKQPRLSVDRRNLFTAPLSVQELKKFDAIIMDPPRAGAQAQAAALAASAVETIVYISCNPATFVKDAGILRQGGYRLKRLRTIDQFLWSPHVELVALFTK